MAKPIKTLELHYQMIQFLIKGLNTDELILYTVKRIEKLKIRVPAFRWSESKEGGLYEVYISNEGATLLVESQQDEKISPGVTKN